MIRKKQIEHKNILRKILESPDVYKEFQLVLTYNSNKIEGSTLSEDETADILFSGVSLSNKTLVEQLEAKNLQTCIIYLFEYLSGGGKIDESLLLKLHSILMNSIRQDAGFYRNHPVRIVGSNVVTANYMKIGKLMEDLFVEIKNNRKNILEKISIIHAKFEQIHPFSDGNGRIGRLLIHAMLLQKNISPAVIKQEDKRIYITYLNKAQTSEDYSLLENFICDAILDGYELVEDRGTK